ncbi:response regulator [Alicyclobacillus fodiniaquatilis]|uniref:Response regulator n=1 Tax=Alicyclobacillus fodiniaquatilis TaxID=1661150 RepID=A0ABW4JEM3_9BACL
MPKTIRALLIEDDPGWQEAIKWILSETEDIVLLATVQNKTDALAVLKYTEPDVVLLDIMLNGRDDGISLIQSILKQHPNTKIIMLSSLESDEIIWEAFLQGATNYIVKSHEYESIPPAIREAVSGMASIHQSSATAMRKIFQRMRHEQLSSMLTPQEGRILSLVYQGKKTPEIQRILDIEAHTIDNHISRINKKFKTTSRKDAAKAAKTMGLLEQYLSDGL